MNSEASTGAAPRADSPVREDVQNPTGKPLPKVNQGTTRMFAADWLEKFSRVHPATPAVLFVPVVLVSLWVSLTSGAFTLAGTAGATLLGYLGWTVAEYWMHRNLFHLKIVGPKTRRLYFLIHGVHHDYPWDISRLVFPPGASILLCFLFFGLFRWAFGPLQMYPYFAGFVSGYVIYDTTHWYIHARVPRTRFGRWLRREHMIHHFKAPTSRFGVSCPWLDYVFRTTGERDTP